jgi:hypothetical protein
MTETRHEDVRVDGTPAERLFGFGNRKKQQMFRLRGPLKKELAGLATYRPERGIREACLRGQNGRALPKENV